jgi:nitrate reductase assembly molybdenum cofactor insertion protein NarJ
MFKATELSDIAGFYRAFGFEMNQEGDRDMVDHISVELEFYSLLMMKYLYLNKANDLMGCRWARQRLSARRLPKQSLPSRRLV